jgi:alkanesulfonate monooxygenase SsuD/methylene tetrahydromethanopterin reductase-like flavin-dependent oxidoreductase (luciferase family)
MDGYWETVDRLGVDHNPYRAGFLQFVAVADDDADAERKYAKHALYFYNRCLNVYRGFVDPPGYRSVETVRAGLQSQVAAAAAAMFSELTWKDIVDRGYVVAGSPQTVADRIHDLADQLRVGHLMLLLQFGDMPRDLTLENTNRFAREVIPKVRDRFAGHDDQWWPATGMAAPARPAPLPAP